MIVRAADEGDLPAILNVQRRAFGRAEEADLVRDMLADPTAETRLSLVAEADGAIVGHVMFTAVRLEGAEHPEPASILAPIAVTPDAQREGVGAALIKDGLKRLKDSGVKLVFVLGDPGYYGRFGFEPAGPAGLNPPFPIPREYDAAWRAMTLGGATTGGMKGRVRCCDALNRPELWSD